MEVAQRHNQLVGLEVLVMEVAQRHNHKVFSNFLTICQQPTTLLAIIGPEEKRRFRIVLISKNLLEEEKQE
jgi:hypothetical protein